MTKNSQSVSLNAIFSAAVQLPDEESRSAFLNLVCRDDLDLKAKIIAMVQKDVDGDVHSFVDIVPHLNKEQSFMSDDSAFIATSIGNAEELGIEEERRQVASFEIKIDQQIGPYKIREKLGEGGMGFVYLAEQKQPVRRKVALKVIKPGMDTKEVIGRFEAERQALAMMSHPNIAKVLDGGTTDQGRPYFVMELVKGQPITQFCDKEKFDTRQRLELFLKVCQAVQHAHMKGIIHRDLKPSNVIVEVDDVRPIPKVIDFGVAKATGNQLTEQTVYTQFTQLVGTPLYMSPEQAQQSSTDVDTRSDIYSLGVLLYELLTGTTPFDKSRLSSVDVTELRRIICEDDPPRPSQRVSTLKNKDVSTISIKRKTDPKQLSLALKRELDWIIMKALEKDRNRRYESASALAADVERYLNDEPVKACPPSVGYKLKKYARKHKATITTAALLVVMLITSTIVSTVFAVQADQAREDAEVSEEKALDAEEVALLQADRAQDESRRANLAAVRAQLAQDMEAAARAKAESALYTSEVRLATTKIFDDERDIGLDLLLNHHPQDEQNDRRSWEWYYLLGEANQSLLTWQASSGQILEIDWSPDGKQLATVQSESPGLQVWNADTGELIRSFTDGDEAYKGVDWSPDGKHLAWGSNSATLRIWSKQEDDITELTMNVNSHNSVRWSPDGTRIVTASDWGSPRRGSVEIWSNQAGEWELTASTEGKDPYAGTAGGHPYEAEWNSTGTLIAIPARRTVQILDVDTLETVQAFTSFPTYTSDLDWSPNRDYLAIGMYASEKRIVDVENQVELKRFDSAVSEDLDWSPTGEFLAMAGNDRTVTIWDTEDWSVISTFTGHAARVRSVAWHPDSTRVASCGDDGRITIWPVESKESAAPIAERSPDQPFIWTNDGLLQTYEQGVGIIDFHPRTGNILRTFEVEEAGEWNFLAANTIYKENAIDEGSEKQTHEFIVKNLEGQETIPNVGPPSGRRFIKGNTDGSSYLTRLYKPPVLVDITEGDSFELQGDALETWVHAFDLSTNRKSVAIVTGRTGWLFIFDKETGKLSGRTRIGLNNAEVGSCQWSPNSDRIAVGTRDGVLEVVDAETLDKLVTSSIHRASIRSISWHPTENRIASGSNDKSVVVLNANTGEELLRFQLDAPVSQVSWSPDGEMLVARLSNGAYHAWDAKDGYDLARSDKYEALYADRLELSTVRQLETRYSSQLAMRSFSDAKETGVQLFNFEQIKTNRGQYLLALLCAANDDADTYKKICQQMLGQYSDSTSAIATHFTAWTCALAPDALDDYEPGITLARRAVDQDQENQQYLDGLGAVLMRAGKYAEAKEQLEKALEAGEDDNTSPSYIHYFLAMTEYHLGNAEAAKEQLATANESADKELEGSPSWNRKMTIELLREEAEALIGKPDDTN